MRRLITLALSLGFVASAAAQTQGEIIVRRPGVPDQVIRLDSTAVKEQVAKVQLNIEPLRTRTLALRKAEFASTSLMLGLESLAGRRPLLGITVRTEPSETDKYGAYISAVTPGSPAEKAGILSGDIITRIAGKSLTEKNGKEAPSPGLRLIEVISTLTVGKPVDIELRRGTKTVTVKVTPIEDASSGAIARMTPGVAEIARLPFERLNNEMSIRGVPVMPQHYNVFTGGNGAFGYSFGNNGLFANVELAALNEKLGSYFGATEGVLVVNIGTRRPFDVFAAAMPGGRMMADTVRMTQRTPSGRATAVGRVIDTTFTIRRNGAGDTVTRKIYIDGVPAQGDVRREPVKIPLDPGDVIVSVDGRKVTSPSQLMRIVGSYDHNDEFKLQIIRQKRPETLTIKMP